jgi:di/tricarboxylate transporter
VHKGVSLLIVPLVIYKLYRLEIKETPVATQLARQKLAEMRRMPARRGTKVKNAGTNPRPRG